MQEIKNNFLKGKMNKDLDDRVLPNGEYRDALNVSVSSSEGDNVGTVQNVKGNTLISDFERSSNPFATSDYEFKKIIADDINKRIYIWIEEPGGNRLYEFRYNEPNFFSGGSWSQTLLCEGPWVFSFKTNFIEANILENYLFWTDGILEPKVINIDLARESSVSGTPYYTGPDTASIAKYAPYKPLLVSTVIKCTLNSLSGDTAVLDNPSIGVDLNVSLGDYVISPDTNQFLGIVEEITTAPDTTTIVLDRSPSVTLTTGENITIYKENTSNQSQNGSWEGDPDFLEDKFARFSYRYKYEDNTYSLIAPYTQPIFKPKQGGHFLEGDEAKTYKSTIVDFMENDINNVKFYVPLPSGQPVTDYKIKEIEIIYTEADLTSAMIAETITIDDALLTTTDETAQEGVYFLYEYASSKPYQSVTQQDFIRVSDQTPISAKAQAIVSNRVVYGNFVTKVDAPKQINFGVTIEEKSGLEPEQVAYKNHTIKQNRTYQAGIVLKDKKGRSSGVISSKFLNDATIAVSTSSAFHEYKDSGWNPGVKQWLGDSLKVNFYDKIGKDTKLYAKESLDFSITSNVSFTSNNTALNVIHGINTSSFNFKDYYLRGAEKDFVKIINADIGTLKFPSYNACPFVNL